jgi:tetratricopeptide (TPR) repeat protein
MEVLAAPVEPVAAEIVEAGGEAGDEAGDPVEAPAGEPGAWTVPVLVEIEGPSLLAAAGEAERLDLEIYAYAVTPQGKVAGFLTQKLTLDLLETAESLYDGGLKLVGSLRLPPGPHSLRVLVMDAASGAYGLRTFGVAVPEAGGTAPRLLAALLPEPPDSWLLVRQDIEPPRRLGGAVPVPEAEAAAGPRPTAPEVAAAPLLAGPDATLPAALPVLDAGRTVEVQLLAYRLPDEVELSAQLDPESAAGGQEAAGQTAPQAATQTLPVDLLARLGTSVPGLERLSGRFRVPQMPTASFRLTFQAAPAAGPAAVTEPLRLIVLADNPLPGRLTWGRLRSVAARLGSGSAAAGELELPRRGKRRVGALERAARQRYENVLRRFGEGASRAEVVEALAAVETELTETDPEAFRVLPAAEQAVAAALAQQQPEALVPLILLHLDLYHHHRAARGFALATGARATSQVLARLYAETAGTDSARSIASRALSALGADLFEAGLRTAGQEAAGTALELDERNGTARLLLGAYYEKMGDYRRAVEILERLVELEPKSAEGRLRLALSRRRLGDEEGARRELSRLLAENNPPWTLTVAYSEMAGAYLAEDRAPEASRLLRQALDRLGGEECLLIQLAFALDRQRKFLEARQVLDRLRTGGGAGGADGPSPRHRYTSWPQQGHEDVWDALGRGSAARLPLLAAALEGLAASTASGKEG